MFVHRGAPEDFLRRAGAVAGESCAVRGLHALQQRWRLCRGRFRRAGRCCGGGASRGARGRGAAGGGPTDPAPGSAGSLSNGALVTMQQSLQWRDAELCRNSRVGGAWREAKPGDVLELLPDAAVPCDCLLVSEALVAAVLLRSRSLG